MKSIKTTGPGRGHLPRPGPVVFLKHIPAFLNEWNAQGLQCRQPRNEVGEGVHARTVLQYRATLYDVLMRAFRQYRHLGWLGAHRDSGCADLNGGFEGGGKFS